MINVECVFVYKCRYLNANDKELEPIVYTIYDVLLLKCLIGLK